jgi:hypothetical protein
LAAGCYTGAALQRGLFCGDCNWVAPPFATDIRSHLAHSSIFFTRTAQPNIILCSHESQANAASDECTADSLAHGLACYATCSAGTVTSDGWTTCVIEGFGGQDTFDALNYYTYISGKGTEGGRLEVRIVRIERQADRPPSNMRRCDVRLQARTILRCSPFV